MSHIKTALVSFAIVLCLQTAVIGQSLRLEPLLSFGTNGALLPDSVGFLQSANRLQRGMAFNPVTGHLLVASRTNTFDNSAENIYILDAETGQAMGTLDMSALTSGGDPAFRINFVGAAADGAIYAGNLTTTTAPPEFRLYRWATELSPQTLVFAGDPGNGDAGSLRWGDSFSVRGAGLLTEIIIASQDGTRAALLRPTDISMTAFSATALASDAPAGSMGNTTSFGAGDTFWTDGGTGEGLYHLAFDANAGSATVLRSFDALEFPLTVVPVGVLATSNLLAAIDIVADADWVRLYDISNSSNPPVLLDRKPFATANGNTGPNPGALAFGNARLYALEGNNGIMAFVLTNTAAPVAPSVYAQPSGSTVTEGSNVVLQVAADGTPPPLFQWQLNGTNMPGATNSSLTLSPAQVSDTGTYTCLASNVAGVATSSGAIVRVLPAALLVYEAFDYTPGELLGGQTTPLLQTWTVVSGTLSNDILLTEGNLAVAGLAAPQGHSVTNGGEGLDLRLNFGTSISNGTVYYSVAVRVDEYGSGFLEGSPYMAALVRSSGNNRATRLVPRPVTNATGVVVGHRFGLLKLATGSPVVDTTVFAPGETVFIVGGYTFDPAGVDTAKLWINPPRSSFGATEPPAPTLVNTNGANLASLNVISLIQATRNPAVFTMDELRVGTSWAAVTPPGPLTPAELNISLGQGEVTVTWPTLAPGYVLERSDSIGADANWSPVSYGVSGTSFFATLPTIGTTFFRLRE